MIKRLKAALRGSIKSLYLRYVWPSEMEGSEWSAENQMKKITLDHMELLGGTLNLGCSLESGGPMGQWLAGLVKTLLTANDGVTPPNYRQIELRLPLALEGSGRDLICLTVQRCLIGKTPHELKAAAERERDSLRSQLASASERHALEVAQLQAAIAATKAHQ